MKSEFSNAKDYVEGLASRGRYHFTSVQAQKALGASVDATKLALNRLRKQGRIARPVRGFYVIVPPEYVLLGCLPADQFVPALMEHLEQDYYVGLLSAAQYYGAAHQRPQEFQVFLEKNRRTIACGSVRVTFIARKQLKQVPIKMFNTPRGTIRVTTPEATAVDLAGYARHAGGWDQSATVLSELAESIDPDKLAEAAKSAPVAWAQRLGYLLDVVEASTIAAPLQAHVSRSARQYVHLSPDKPDTAANRSKEWKLIVNDIVEPDL